MHHIIKLNKSLRNYNRISIQMEAIRNQRKRRKTKIRGMESQLTSVAVAQKTHLLHLMMMKMEILSFSMYHVIWNLSKCKSTTTGCH